MKCPNTSLATSRGSFGRPNRQQQVVETLLQVEFQEGATDLLFADNLPDALRSFTAISETER